MVLETLLWKAEEPWAAVSRRVSFPRAKLILGTQPTGTHMYTILQDRQAADSLDPRCEDACIGRAPGDDECNPIDF